MISKLLFTCGSLAGICQGFSGQALSGGFVPRAHSHSLQRSALLSTVVQDDGGIVMPKARLSSFWEMNAETLFRTIDIDNSGDIDMDELQLLASELFPESVWDEDDIDSLMKDMDIDNNRLVDFEEFKRWLSLQEQVSTSQGARRRVVTSNNVMEVENQFKDGLSPRKEELSYDAIQSIIDVSRPYYALENEGAVKVGDETIGFVADLSPEMLFPYEGGQLGFCETVRHMAIAGSVAAAFVNPKKTTHYYLALNGSMRHNEVLPSSIQDGIDKILPFTEGRPRIFAYSTGFNKRETTSEIFLFTGKTNNDVIRLNVSYKIIAAPLFTRFFPEVEGIDKSMLGPWTPAKNNPYTNPIDIPISSAKVINHDNISYNAKIPRVCPSKCHGHFDTSPCLPVAFLIGHLVDAAMQSVALLCKENGVPTKPLIGKDGFLDASALVQAGTHGLNIKGLTERIDKGVYKFTFDAFVDEDGSDGEQIAYLALTFAETEGEELPPPPL